jgi:hypothetical protein
MFRQRAIPVGPTPNFLTGRDIRYVDDPAASPGSSVQPLSYRPGGLAAPASHMLSPADRRAETITG